MIHRGIVFLVLLIYTIKGEIETINLQDSCTFTIYNPNEDKSFYLEWDGETVNDAYCSMSFKGKGSDIFDEYKVCVEPVNFDLSCNDRNVEVTYSTGVVGKQRKVYGCNDKPSKFCTASDTYLDISLNNAALSASGYSSFELKITAIKTYNHSAVVGGIAGGVIFVVVVSVVILILCYKKRYLNSHQNYTIQQGVSNPGVSTITSTNASNVSYLYPSQPTYQHSYPNQEPLPYNYPSQPYSSAPPPYSVN